MSTERRSICHYLLALVTLAASALGMQVAKSRGSFQLIKKPLPLRKALVDMDRDSLLPYEVASARRLPPEVVGELGTEEYLDWGLRVPEGRVGPPRMTLSVTYYTGVQDQVPHVPEECLHQASYTQRDSHVREVELKELKRLDQAVKERNERLKELGKKPEGPETPIKFHELSFNPPRGTGNVQYVYYTICVNGDYYADRQRVRFRLADFSEAYLYYSKVEVSFRVGREKNLPAVSKQAYELLDMALAELVRSHYPLSINPEEVGVSGVVGAQGGLDRGTEAM
ncbi:MAG: hypothetical protein ABII12_16870 [Planctomycetota bacterium]